MEEYIYNEEGTERVFFAGPAADFLLLLLSIRNKSSDWKIKAINHAMSLQKSLLGKAVDNFTVAGGHYTMLPAPWLKMSQIAIVNKHVDGIIKRQLPIHNGERVTFSKMPVIFNKAIADMELQTGLPRNMFGEMTDRMIVALRNMMFCNVDVMLMHQNDTDGDMARISCTGGTLPVFDGMPEHLNSWTNEYMDDEYDMQLKAKPYAKYNLGDMDVAVKESMENKQYIGRASNDLFYWSHLLQIAVNRNVISFEDSVLLRDAYACGLQSIVRGVKHTDTGGADFKACSMSAVLFDRRDPEAPEPRGELASLVWQYVDRNMNDVLTTLLAWFDIIAMNPMSPLATRRNADMEAILFSISDIENDIKLLDSITNSFVYNAALAQPAHNISSKSDGEQAIQQIIMGNPVAYKMYRHKYQILGQNMTKFGENTVLGELYRIWDSLTDVDFCLSKDVNKHPGAAMHNNETTPSE